MIILGLGSNLGFLGLSPEAVLRDAVWAIGTLGTVVDCSSIYDSPAWPDPTAPAYVNAALHLETSLNPESLLAALHGIEAGFGRTRGYLKGKEERYAPRTLDLDILDYNGEILNLIGGVRDLTLPHPSIQNRDFVLLPLAEIAPDWTHPITGMPVVNMIDGLENVTAEIREQLRQE